MIYINKEYVSFRNKDLVLDRNGLPAVIDDNKKVWIKNGKLHRLDGPAFIKDHGETFWIDGVNYPETDYHDKIKEMGIVT